MKERVKVFDEKMTKAYNHLLSEYQTIRAGRANPHVLDKIKVDYYGTPTPLQQVGNISVPEPRMLQIAPWEKSLIRAIEKAIMPDDHFFLFKGYILGGSVSAATSYFPSTVTSAYIQPFRYLPPTEYPPFFVSRLIYNLETSTSGFPFTLKPSLAPCHTG